MKLRFFVLFLVLALLFGSCATPSEYNDTVFFAMDTYITIRLAQDGVSEEELTAVAVECERLVKELETVLSAHDPDSELYQLNESDAEFVPVSDTLEEVLLTAVDLAEKTDGAYDFTLGGLAELWNVTGGGPVPSREAVDEVLSHVGYENVTVDERRNTVMRPDAEVRLDLGGIGKGAAADVLVRYLETTIVPYGLVSVGGTIGVFGEKPDGTPYKIGIRDPEDANAVLGYLHISDGFVAVSGDYERYFEENGVRYHHIFDPSTGYPADTGLRETVVHSDTGTVADALSTALFVLGTDAALDLYATADVGFEAVLVGETSVTVTDNAVVEWVN